MGKRPARIRVRLGNKAVRVTSQSRNPRGVHYTTGEISVYRDKLTKDELRQAVSKAIETLSE